MSEHPAGIEAAVAVLASKIDNQVTQCVRTHHALDNDMAASREEVAALDRLLRGANGAVGLVERVGIVTVQLENISKTMTDLSLTLKSHAVLIQSNTTKFWRLAVIIACAGGAGGVVSKLLSSL